MTTNHSGIDSVSVPVAILIGAVIIAASVLLAGARISSSAAVGAQAVGVAAGAAAQPKVNNRVGDIKQVKTTNSPIAGSASAPIIMAYWFDYQCPVCRTFEEKIMTEVKREYIDTGKIRVVYKDLQFLGPDSQTLGLLARAVWQLAPDKYPAWHKALFDNQGQEHSGWATPDAIKKFSTPVLGVDLTAKAMALAESNKTTFKTMLDADKSEGGTYGINATPSMIIGNKVMVGLSQYANVKAAIEEALKRK